MDLTPIVALTGLSLQALSTTALMYGNIFKKSNLEKFFKSLLETQKDLGLIGEREDIQRYFFSILEEVSNEANLEKLESWKNAVIHLATDFQDFDFKDNFISVLSSLSVFDLTVLYKIYSIQADKFQGELIEFFMQKQVDQDFVMLAEKRLAANHLLDEYSAAPGRGPGVSLSDMSMGDILKNLVYKKNNMGPKFINFITDTDQTE